MSSQLSRKGQGIKHVLGPHTVGLQAYKMILCVPVDIVDIVLMSCLGPPDGKVIAVVLVCMARSANVHAVQSRSECGQ